MGKRRIDQLLLDKGLCESLDQARRTIMAGLVQADHEVIDKVGMKVPEEAVIELKQRAHPYVSRGGMKLEKAITAFHISLQQRIVLDIGASTGGFTDCALQQGALSVYAVDVGYGQLAWKLRQDQRVVVLERTNFRYLSNDMLCAGQPSVATIDVSFISLRKILPNLYQMLTNHGDVIALIKPQFEAERDQVGEKGIVDDPVVHLQVLQRVQQLANQMGFTPIDYTGSPIRGAAGNIEYLVHLIKGATERLPFASSQLEAIVQQTHRQFGLQGE